MCRRVAKKNFPGLFRAGKEERKKEKEVQVKEKWKGKEERCETKSSCDFSHLSFLEESNFFSSPCHFFFLPFFVPFPLESSLFFLFNFFLSLISCSLFFDVSSLLPRESPREGRRLLPLLDPSFLPILSLFFFFSLLLLLSLMPPGKDPRLPSHQDSLAFYLPFPHIQVLPVFSLSFSPLRSFSSFRFSSLSSNIFLFLS